MSFDEHSADYSQKMDRALTVVGLEHDFFFEAKVLHILEAARRMAACAAERSERQCWPSLGQPALPAVPAAGRVLEIGCGIGLLTQRLRPLLTDVWGSTLPSPAGAGRGAGRPSDRRRRPPHAVRGRDL